MATNSVELRQKRMLNHNLMKDMIQSAKEAGVKPDQELWDRYLNEDTTLTTQINKVELDERQAAIQAEGALKQIEKAAPKAKDDVKRYQDAWYKFMTKRGGQSITAEEEAILFRGTGNQTAGTTTEGGFLVPEGFSGELFTNKALWGGMFEVARIVHTSTGNVLPWPKVDDTGTTGALLTEGSAVTVADIAYTELQLDAYLYHSKMVKVSEQLLQDSAFSISDHLEELFVRRIGGAENAAFTTGTGSSQPNGVVTAASSGLTAADNTSVTRAELNTLVHSVNPVWRKGPSVGFMMNDDTLSKIKGVSIGNAASDNGALWMPGLGENEPDRIEGKKVFINQDCADMANSTKSILFGDFSQYIIRVVDGSQSVRRFDELYSANLLIGFMAYERVDGDLLAGDSIKFITQFST